MSTGYIKEQPVTSWRKFNFIIKTIDLDNQIRHLFIADIEFHKKSVTLRQSMYNKIYCPIAEKKNKKKLDASERSIFQLIEQY